MAKSYQPSLFKVYCYRRLVKRIPELPEITVIAKQMDKEIKGKKIVDIEVKQPKNLNMPVPAFAKIVKGKTVSGVSSHGKWLLVKLSSNHFMLVNLGMGAELLYFAKAQKLPEKYHFKLVFSDETGFTAHFWWFGYIHLVKENELHKHKMTAQLGKPATDKTFTLGYFQKLLAGKKTGIKTFLLDQKNLAGIGNVYAQDILFKAKVHPNRKISTLSEKEIKDLHHAVQDVLKHSIKLKGLAYERDFYGQKGKLTVEGFLVGYKTGKPCPECGTRIEKIKTGSTSSYICPKCQKLT
jgi:formamidopyrimidine-DNA glycosylase